MTKSIAATLALAAMGWCAIAPAHAQTPTSLSRIAWLSPERIYNESKLAKLASEKLQEEFKSREKAMAEMEGRLKAASAKLEKDAPALAEAERARRQREFREDLSQRTNEERQAISDRATKIIRQMADTEGFDIVLQDAVWASKRIDITDKVLAALDKDK